MLSGEDSQVAAETGGLALLRFEVDLEVTNTGG